MYFHTDTSPSKGHFLLLVLCRLVKCAPAQKPSNHNTHLRGLSSQDRSVAQTTPGGESTPVHPPLLMEGPWERGQLAGTNTQPCHLLQPLLIYRGVRGEGCWRGGDGAVGSTVPRPHQPIISQLLAQGLSCG